jgi:beta-glucosidase-like glycosyl hydrolase
VTCGYNRINNVYACENNLLLHDVFRHDWGYKGWAMSDWGAVHSVSIRAGLDQESGRKPTDKAHLQCKNPSVLEISAQELYMGPETLLGSSCERRLE